MSPPFIVVLEKNIKQSTGWLKRKSSKQNGVRESNMNTGNIKTMNLKEIIFAKLKSAMKSNRSKQNGSPESSRSKNPKSISKSIVNETPLSARSIKTGNLKVSSYSELKSATKKSRSKHNGLTESIISKSVVNEKLPSSTENFKTLNLRSTMKSNCSKQKGLAESSSRSRSKSILNETPTGGGNIKTPNLKVFTYAELKLATRNFNPSTLLGEGGFGQVFMGWVNKNTYVPSKFNMRMAVAIKKSNPDSRQGLKEWQSEIKFLGNLSHPNIIKLLGYCREDEEFFLVYEYAEKRSLEYHLFRRGEEPLPWGIRLKIAIGAARGLSFLHTLEKPIFYRDFKTSNILLDRDCNAKLSDFGLATDGELNENTHVTPQIKDTLGVTNGDIHVTTHIKCSNGDTQVTTQIRSMLGPTCDDTQVTTQISWTNGRTHVTTQIRGSLSLKSNCSHMTMGVTGTYGYAAPEYIATGHLNIKSDVYSFGVVVLELLTGLPAIDNSRSSGRHSLVDWAKPLLSRMIKLKTIMDPRLQDQYPAFGAYQTAQIALKCLESDPQNRPSMVQVLENLEQIDASTGRKQSSPKPARRTTVYESLKSFYSSRVCTSTLSSTAIVGTGVRAQAH